MRKFNIFISFMMIVGLTLLFMHTGCKTNDDPSGPSDVSYQNNPYSHIDLDAVSADPTSSGLNRYIITVDLVHNNHHGAPASEITVTLTTSAGSFSETGETMLTKVTTTNYVQDGEDRINVDLFYGFLVGTGIINAQTDHGDGAKPLYLRFGDETTDPTPTPTPEPYLINLNVANRTIGGDTRQFTSVTATVQHNTRSVQALRIRFETENGGCVNPEYAFTDFTGFASTMLQSGLALSVDRIAYVHATYTDANNITYESEKIAVTFLAPGFTLKVSPGSYTVNVGSSTMLTAHLSDYSDVSVENYDIAFSIEGNRGSFSMDSELRSTTIPTDSYGNASVILTSSETGPVIVMITFNAIDCDGVSTDSMSKTLNITFN